MKTTPESAGRPLRRDAVHVTDRQVDRDAHATNQQRARQREEHDRLTGLATEPAEQRCGS
jgi:hypothetical protein